MLAGKPNHFDKQHPHQANAKEFCAHLLKNCGYQDQDDLDTIISGLSALDYLYCSPKLPTLRTSEKRGYRIVSINERATVEQEFLQKIAYHYVDEVKESGRQISLSYFLTATGYYKTDQQLPSQHSS